MTRPTRSRAARHADGAGVADRVAYAPRAQWSDAGVTITGSEHHHLSRVLRFREGERLVVVDGEGARAVFEVADVSRDATRCGLISREPFEPEPRIAVELAPCITRTPRMDWLVEKAAELGVASIAPIRAERTIVRRSPREDRGQAERWERVAVAAMKQSRRARKPRIREPVALADYLAARRGARLLVPWEAAPRRPLRTWLQGRPLGAGASVAVLIGPEGGLTSTEAEAAERAGGELVSLGEAILRAETAAVVAVTAILYEGEVI